MGHAVGRDAAVLLQCSMIGMAKGNGRTAIGKGRNPDCGLPMAVCRHLASCRLEGWLTVL